MEKLAVNGLGRTMVTEGLQLNRTLKVNLIIGLDIRRIKTEYSPNYVYQTASIAAASSQKNRNDAVKVSQKGLLHSTVSVFMRGCGRYRSR